MMEKRWTKWFIKVVSLLIAALIYWLFTTATNFYIPCLFHFLTKLYCPGCGMTRAFFALLHFDFLQAFFYNPFIYVFLLIILYSLGGELYYLLTKQAKKLIYPQKLMISLLVLLLIFGILRNIPGFEFLLPHDIR